MMQMFQL